MCCRENLMTFVYCGCVGLLKQLNQMKTDLPLDHGFSVPIQATMFTL